MSKRGRSEMALPFSELKRKFFTDQEKDHSM